MRFLTSSQAGGEEVAEAWHRYHAKLPLDAKQQRIVDGGMAGGKWSPKDVLTANGYTREQAQPFVDAIVKAGTDTGKRNEAILAAPAEIREACSKLASLSIWTAEHDAKLENALLAAPGGLADAKFADIWEAFGAAKSGVSHSLFHAHLTAKRLASGMVNGRPSSSCTWTPELKEAFDTAVINLGGDLKALGPAAIFEAMGGEQCGLSLKQIAHHREHVCDQEGGSGAPASWASNPDLCAGA